MLEHPGCTILIDPYLSDSVGKRSPEKSRRVPVDETFFDVKPDVMIFTHNHLDHYDPETVAHYIRENSDFVVLAPSSVWNEVRLLGGKVNYVVFNRHTTWTEKGISFTAVKAEHSDPTAIGVVICDGEKKYYITGDTLYNEDIFADIPEDNAGRFLPVNGVGNNMNMVDAARFARRVSAKKVVPIHTGMMDSLSASDFPADNKIIPEIYKEIAL